MLLQSMTDNGFQQLSTVLSNVLATAALRAIVAVWVPPYAFLMDFIAEVCNLLSSSDSLLSAFKTSSFVVTSSMSLISSSTSWVRARTSATGPIAPAIASLNSYVFWWAGLFSSKSSSPLSVFLMFFIFSPRTLRFGLLFTFLNPKGQFSVWDALHTNRFLWPVTTALLSVATVWVSLLSDNIFWEFTTVLLPVTTV
ncbi:hypothetical protein FF38_03393 [Lucilia cuprina]|uniref:Uncharacterized protein n=1 Tax=Lucilia cuprina TaxID=7375 RepID=A0A0L0BZZ5_LUCCU|nr:hypothetical protein FF38_03393 [Lucilia cuprina]